MTKLSRAGDAPASRSRRSRPVRAELRAITRELDVVMGSAAAVETACASARKRLHTPLGGAEERALAAVASALQGRGGAIVVPVFDLVLDAAKLSADPWPLLAALLAVRDPALVERALDTMISLSRAGSMALDRDRVRLLDALLGDEDRGLGETGVPAKVEALVESGGGVSVELAPDAHALLKPYLDYTRATYRDLARVAEAVKTSPRVLDAFRTAEGACGAALLREVIAELGWGRVNLGVEARRVVGVSIEGSLPIVVTPSEAVLFERVGGARRVFDAFVFFAHGGAPSDVGGGAPGAGPIDRFRAYNLAHAEVLAEILDVAPLDRARVERVVRRMDAIVEGFDSLFRAHAAECALLRDVYAHLKGRVVAEMETHGEGRSLSADLCRLVLAFEDPANLGEVRTLHGLKRWLHQRGMRLGFELLGAGHTTNRTVDVVLASPSRITASIRTIHYADFEPAPDAERDSIPPAIRIAAEGLARSLLYGARAFPHVDAFCFGNEVHYFLAFRNHPAFVRVDYSPPVRGGMIDLQYFGVSNYELETHPNRRLDAIRHLFERLEFQVTLEGTRLNVRYDKERGLDFGDVCERARAVFRLAPHLMDLDWTISSLRLDEDARREVARAWASTFLRVGALPVSELVTDDRLAILEAVERGVTGPTQVAWSGHGVYKDRFTHAAPATLWPALRAAVEALGVRLPPAPIDDEPAPLDAVRVEAELLGPLRDAVARGAVVEAADGLAPASAEQFEWEHEADALARIAGAGARSIASAIDVARLLSPIERTLRFETTGRVAALDVQRARVALPGGRVTVFVARDASGAARMAAFTHGDRTSRSRPRRGRAWRTTLCTDARALAVMLRRANYLGPSAGPVGADASEEAARLYQELRAAGRPERAVDRTGECVVPGLAAAPGRAVGRVVFGTAGRAPADFDGGVLVAPAVRPADAAYIYHAAAIVSTGGSVLSHAGLLAVQFRKPALIVVGRFQEGPHGTRSLRCAATTYAERTHRVAGFGVTVRDDIRQSSTALHEGDLVVVDVEAGELRVPTRHRDAIALHDALRQLRAAAREAAAQHDPRRILVSRGHRLRARHQIERILERAGEPGLARHAVEELLVGDDWSAGADAARERAGLLARLFGNARVGASARVHLEDVLRGLERRVQSRLRVASARIPSSRSAYEVLSLRNDVLRLSRSIEGASDALEDSGPRDLAATRDDVAWLDRRARQRLEELRDEAAAELLADDDAPGAGHALRLVERLDALLGHPEDGAVAARRDRWRRSQAALHERCRDRRVLAARECTFELHAQIGRKAANLAEIVHLGGPGLTPAWFAVTSRAFDEALGLAADGARTLGDAIDAVLERADLDDRQKSAHVAGLWERVRLPESIAGEVARAYGELAAAGEGIDAADASGDAGEREPFVAIRSSSCEEDAETATRAGEFDTFLFVRGAQSVVEHVKRTWAGLWTARAIHGRRVLGLSWHDTGGGVIVQRMIASRVSGVLQTVNVAGNEPDEMVIDVGLGLGEGVVDGSVAADHVTVRKSGLAEGGPTDFNYTTSDKREQVVFDARAGAGTRRATTPYHQSLRPALEYTELSELTGVAARLETAYRFPLDIEFAIEGKRLWILQARPVATFLALVEETAARYPFVHNHTTRSPS